MRNPVGLLCTLLLCSAVGAAAQPARPALERATRAYDAAVKQGPLATYAFLLRFPKGADLHVHLSGAVYADTFIRDAGEDGLCVDTVALRFTSPPCTGTQVPAVQLSGDAVQGTNQDLYDRLIDSFSMRNFVPSSGWSGHDQFFATFGRFGGLDKRHLGEWVDEVARLADSQNQQYLELMQTPPFTHATEAGKQVGWPKAGEPVDLARIRRDLLDRGVRNEVPADMANVRDIEARRNALEYCGTAEAVPACHVQVRYIYQVLRGNPPEQVFAQTLLGFETVERSIDSGEPGFVGINFVQPEDGYLSMRDYTLQMQMVGYLHSLYPKVHISLHAGELVPGLVPPAGLRFHIREAVEMGHAERIGHGVDILYERRAPELLQEMAARHVMVEINLSSNEGILGISGAKHPFPLYRAAHVPVALSTDDEGVSRIEITHEYTRAALDYRLTYADLKQLARASMEHSFLAGASLWAIPDEFARPAGACRSQLLGSEKPLAACQTFLDKNEKAAAQWELERRFREFEAKL
jgi:adenosine deaminase